MFSFWSLDLRLSDILFFLLPRSSTLLIPFFMLFKVLLQGLQGPSTVGNRVFDSRVQLSIGLIKAFGLKDWIPAKVLPATCWNNCALQKYKLYCYCMPASDLRPEVVTVTSLPVFCLWRGEPLSPSPHRIQMCRVRIHSCPHKQCPFVWDAQTTTYAWWQWSKHTWPRMFWIQDLSSVLGRAVTLLVMR